MREAFKFYEKVLEGKIEGIMTHGESPLADKVAPEWRAKVIHVRLKVGDRILMGSDAPPQHYEKPQGFSVSLSVNNAAEAGRLFRALSEGGEVGMPLQKTFRVRCLRHVHRPLRHHLDGQLRADLVTKQVNKSLWEISNRRRERKHKER